MLFWDINYIDKLSTVDSQEDEFSQIRPSGEGEFPACSGVIELVMLHWDSGIALARLHWEIVV